MNSADGDSHATKDATPGKLCVHCGRRCGTLAGGFARIAGHPVCSRPVEPDRPDCYRMVMVKFHKLTDCPECAVAGNPSPPRPPRMGFGFP